MVAEVTKLGVGIGRGPENSARVNLRVRREEKGSSSSPPLFLLVLVEEGLMVVSSVILSSSLSSSVLPSSLLLLLLVLPGTRFSTSSVFFKQPTSLALISSKNSSIGFSFSPSRLSASNVLGIVYSNTSLFPGQIHFKGFMVSFPRVLSGAVRSVSD